MLQKSYWSVCLFVFDETCNWCYDYSDNRKTAILTEYSMEIHQCNELRSNCYIAERDIYSLCLGWSEICHRFSKGLYGKNPSVWEPVSDI